MPVLKLQRQTDTQTIEYDLRRRHVVVPTSRLNMMPLPFDEPIVFSDASFCFQQFKHAMAAIGLQGS
jgi:hypothetical protein